MRVQVGMQFRVKLTVLMAIVAQQSPSPPHSPPPATAGYIPAR
jgi:hypothetical protein